MELNFEELTLRSPKRVHTFLIFFYNTLVFLILYRTRKGSIVYILVLYIFAFLVFVNLVLIRAAFRDAALHVQSNIAVRRRARVVVPSFTVFLLSEL